ncbi:hypothetical protein MKY98_02915 [Paenibacillus sp. FSL M8-0228]|uniref:hypothetical protein n=1 Tax=Paenibacillus sp. FSL M8-0228 TaxID=2921620 RepID=UPI0030F9A5BC
MTDKHYVDKNSIRNWIISEKTEFKDGESNYTRGRVDGLELLLRLLDGGKFDPDPPQQPDIQVGDVPQHILSAYKETNSFLHYNGKIYRVTQRLTGFECVSNGGDTP